MTIQNIFPGKNMLVQRISSNNNINNEMRHEGIVSHCLNDCKKKRYICFTLHHFLPSFALRKEQRIYQLFGLHEKSSFELNQITITNNARKNELMCTHRC